MNAEKAKIVRLVNEVFTGVLASCGSLSKAEMEPQRNVYRAVRYVVEASIARISDGEMKRLVEKSCLEEMIDELKEVGHDE